MNVKLTAENHYKSKTETERAETITKLVEKMINQKINENK